VRSFKEIKNPSDELRCTLQRVEMQKGRQSAQWIEKYAALTEQKLAQRA